MDPQQARWIIECLPCGRTPYAYFADRYAHELLAWQAGSGVTINRLKQSAYGRLLNRPSVKPIVAACGSGLVTADNFTSYWPQGNLYFNLGLGLWAERMSSVNDILEPRLQEEGAA